MCAESPVKALRMLVLGWVFLYGEEKWETCTSLINDGRQVHHHHHYWSLIQSGVNFVRSTIQLIPIKFFITPNSSMSLMTTLFQIYTGVPHVVPSTPIILVLHKRSALRIFYKHAEIILRIFFSCIPLWDLSHSGTDWFPAFTWCSPRSAN